MTLTIEQWDFIELSFNAHSHANPFLDIDLSVSFTHQHRSVKVAGFYDGSDVFKARFMPDMEGDWHYTTSSNLEALDNQRGEFSCVAASGDNHGPVRVIDASHFAYADGRPYHPVGTTCYVWNLQGDAMEEQTLATLKTAPFNKMRM
jgi:hypothetical protein